MNIDLANHKNKTHVPSNARKLLNILDSCNLTQIIYSFTRIYSTSKTLIDHAYVNNNKEIIHTAVSTMVSAIIIPSVLPESTRKTRIEQTADYWSLNNFDTNCLVEDMCSCSWADAKNCLT